MRSTSPPPHVHPLKHLLVTGVCVGLLLCASALLGLAVEPSTYGSRSWTQSVQVDVVCLIGGGLLYRWLLPRMGRGYYALLGVAVMVATAAAMAWVGAPEALARAVFGPDTLGAYVGQQFAPAASRLCYGLVAAFVYGEGGRACRVAWRAARESVWPSRLDG